MKAAKNGVLHKSYLTILVEGATSDEVRHELADFRLGRLEVLARGDFSEADATISESDLPNVVWLHRPHGFEPDDLHLVQQGTGDDGRELTEEELLVLRQFGVCTEFKVTHRDAAEYGTPAYAHLEHAAAAEVFEHGFKVLADGFVVTSENGDDGAEQRWLRIIMPAWFNIQP